MRLAVFALSTVVVGGSGCMPERCRVGNGDLSMVVRAVDLYGEDGEEVHVTVDFATGDRAYLPIPWSICEGDKVQINGEDARESQQDGFTVYTRAFPGDVGETITIELNRANEDDPIEASVERAPRFEVMSPEPGAALSRSEEIVLTWEPPLEGGEMQIELLEELGGGRCIVTDDPEHDYKGFGGVRVPDTGSWTIPASTLANEGELRCSARYVLRRFSRGEYPSNLAPGGFVEAQSLRLLLFESAP
jgi:hypothetical protein